MKEDFDDLLKAVAKRIYTDMDMDNIGGELGLEPSEIQRYTQTKDNYPTATYMGTLQYAQGLEEQDYQVRRKVEESHDCA